MFGEHASTFMMAAGVALAAFICLRATWRRRELPPALLPESPGSSGKASPADAPPELQRWQVEMQETARDLKAELDSKLSALQSLVALARHERILLEATIARAAGDALEVPTGTLAAIESLGDPVAVEDPQRLAEVAAHFPLPDEPIPDLFARDRELIRVGRLADQGLAPASIAEHLQLPLGEVELLLSLRAN